MQSKAELKKIKEVLRKELDIVKPSDSELFRISSLVNNFLSLLKPELARVGADVIVGGSFSKNTLIKKDKYDIDFFVRFENKPKNKRRPKNLSDALEKVLSKVCKRIEAKPSLKIKKLKGSRDYFSIKLADSQVPFPITFEIVPVLYIKNAKEAENVTDVSPLHVKYVQKQIKHKSSLADEIRLAKAFCHAQSCYGAESHIRGFSGYALELLTCYYGSFLNFIRAASKWPQKKPKQVIVDPAKYYARKNALKVLNEAKLLSPLILIDPTQADRNATAALSLECFNIFVNASRNFLRRPGRKFFMTKTIDKKKLQEEAKRKKAKLIILEVKSNKLKEDISGAKLLKFFNSLSEELKKDFAVLRVEEVFNSEKNSAIYFFIIKPLSKVIVKGPPLRLKKHAQSFKKKWPKCTAKKGVLYAVRKTRSYSSIFSSIKDLHKRGIKRMRIVN